MDENADGIHELFDLSFVAARAANEDFIRREDVLAEIEARLAEPSCRIVLVRGDPGTGKTTLMAALAHRHPDWLRYFIRRAGEPDVSGTHGGHDGGLASFLITIGLQFAASREDLFPEHSDEELDISAAFAHLPPGSRAEALRIERLLLHPFGRFAAKVRMSVGTLEGHAVGVYIGEIGQAALEHPAALEGPALLAPLERLRRLHADEHVVVILDGLDELRVRDAPADVGRWLMAHAELHPNLRMVIASRGDDERLAGLLITHRQSIRVVDASSGAGHAVADYAGKVAVKPHVRRVLGVYNMFPEQFARRATTRANGVFQYVSFLDRALAEAAREGTDPVGLDWLATDIDEWPNGIGDLYARFMIRIRDQVTRISATAAGWDRVYLPLLGLLAVAHSPLTQAQLSAFAGIGRTESEVADATCRIALAMLGQFIDGDAERGYVFFHRSVADYIVDPDTVPSLRREEEVSHRQITEYAFGKHEADGSWQDADPYLRMYLAAHAAAIRQLDKLIEDPRFLVAADPAELLATLENAVRAAPVAVLYRRVAPEFKLGLAALALAHLELSAREAGLDDFAARVRAIPGDRPWTMAWTRRGRIPVRGVVGRHEEGIKAIAIAHDDDQQATPLALTGGADGQIKVWDLRRQAGAGPALAAPESHSSITALATGQLRSGEPFVVAGTFDGVVRAWNVSTRTPICPPLAGAENAGFARAVCSLRGGPGTGELATACEALGKVRIWDVTAGVPLGPPYPVSQLTKVAMCVSGGRVLAAIASSPESGREHVVVIDAATGQPIGPPLHTEETSVRALAIAEYAGEPVVAISDIGLGVQIFNPQTGEARTERRIFWHDDSDALAIGILDEKLLLASGGRSGLIKLRDLATGALVGEPVEAYRNGRVKALSIGQEYVLAAGLDYAENDPSPVIQRWEHSGGQGLRLRSAIAAPGEVTSMAEVIRQDTISLGCCDEHRVWVVDAATGRPQGRPAFGSNERVRTITAARLDDGTPVAVAGVEETIRVWDLDRGAELYPPLITAGRGGGMTTALAISRRRGRQVVISGARGTGVRVWDLASGQPIEATLADAPEYLDGMAAGEVDGKAIIVFGSRSEIAVHDMETEQVIIRLPSARFTQSSMLGLFRDDGRAALVADAGNMGAIVVYDLAPLPGQPSRDPRLIPVPDEVAALAVTEVDGQPVVACGGREGNLQIIDLRAGSGDAPQSAALEKPMLSVALAAVAGQPVVVGVSEDEVVVLSLATGRRATPSPVAFRPSRTSKVVVAEIDGRAIGLCSAASDIHAWFVDSGEPAAMGHVDCREYVESLATGLLNERIVVIAGCFDQKVRIFDLITGDPVGDPIESGSGRAIGVGLVSSTDPAILVMNRGGLIRSRFVGLPPVEFNIEDLLAPGPDFSAEEETPPAPLRVGRKVPLNRSRHVSGYTMTLGVLDGTPVVLSGHDNGDIDIFTVGTALPVGAPLTAHDSEVTALAFAEFDGRPVAASGARDGTVHIWDLADGSSVTSVHTAALVRDLALHPSGYCVIGTERGLLAVRFGLPARTGPFPPGRIPFDVRGARACPRHETHVTRAVSRDVEIVRMCIKGIHLGSAGSKPLHDALGHCYLLDDLLVIAAATVPDWQPGDLGIPLDAVHIECQDVPHAYEYDGGHFRINLEGEGRFRSLCCYRRSERDLLARLISERQQKLRGQ